MKHLPEPPTILFILINLSKLKIHRALILWMVSFRAHLRQSLPYLFFTFQREFQDTTHFLVFTDLGVTQYTVWSTRSTDLKKLYPMRKKKWQCSISFIFSSDMQEKQWYFYFKSRKIMWNLSIFMIKKITFRLFLIFFLPISGREDILFFIFFPPTRAKRPLSDLVDQTMYWVSPNQEKAFCVNIN